jgi:hypothetical protein
MRTRLSVALVLSLCALAGCLASGAAAKAPNPLDDCSQQGRLTHTYSETVLKHALATMPADVKEYTDCYDVINRALLADVGGVKGGGGGSGGSFLPTPVIVIIVVVLLAAATFGALAWRRRREGGGPPSTSGGPPSTSG